MITCPAYGTTHKRIDEVPATTELVVPGYKFADGTPLPMYACDACRDDIVTYQKTLGVEVTSTPLTADVEPRNGCPALWRSHGCNLPAGHDGEHLCDGGCGLDGKGDRPGPDDNVWQWGTDGLPHKFPIVDHR